MRSHLRTGKLVIPAAFDAAMDFQDGLALVEVHTCGDADRDKKSGKCMQNRSDEAGYIDRQGRFVVPVTQR